MPAYEVRIERRALATLGKAEEGARKRLLERIWSLKENPRPHGCVKLRGRDLYRIRAGDDRAVYAIRERLLLVLVIKVGHRRDVYRGI